MSGSTTAYPYDTIVEVTDEIGGVAYQASGVLISPDEVLTASHVVWQTGVGSATDIEVSPGYEDGATPFGTIAGVSIHYNQIDDSDDEISSADSQSDYAVIHLATPFTGLGTMGVEANFAGGEATVSGYPAVADGTQIDQAENFTVDPNYTLYDGRALGDGSSGGPVWIDDSSGNPYVVGLVSSGSGRSGYFVQITTAVYNQIEAWVAQDDATTSAPPAPAGDTLVTVTGAGGATVTLGFPAATATLATTLLGQVSTDIAAGTLVGENATAGAALPAVPTGQAGELVVSQAQTIVVPSTYQAVIDNSAAATTIVLATNANVSVAGAGAKLTLMAGNTSGTLVGGSDGVVFTEAANGGAWDIALAGGANTVVAAGGNDTIAAGSGANLMFLGTGASSVASSGTDTIIGGTGASTIATAANQALIFAGASALSFVAGSATSTVIAGAGGATVQGGAGGTLFFGNGASSYVGAGAADTVLGGSGPLTANAGGGASLIFGGTNGGNRLSTGGGQATLVGGGSGDVLRASGDGNAVLVATSGAETLNGAQSSGANVLFGGFASDSIVGGSGNDAIVAGEGNDTLAGGGGFNVFLFINGFGGGSDVVTDFSAHRDYIQLIGFGTGIDVPTLEAAIVKSQTVTSAGTQITLPDGTHILFAGVSGLTGTSFL